MTPGTIRDANFVFAAPGGMDNCGNLHVQRFVDGDLVINTSAWFPTPDEVKRLVEGQPVWLHVYGAGHPVVAMTVPED